MQVIVSDNRETVVVIDGETEEQLTTREFIKIYGEDKLPKEKSGLPDKETRAMIEEIHKSERSYLNLFLEFLDADGKYIHLFKLQQNAQDGVYPVQQVAYQYGHVGIFDQELDDRNRGRWSKLRALNVASQCAGYLPMDEAGMQKVMNFFEDSDRRRYVRDNIRRMLKNDECMSIADLMQKRYQVEKKTRERSKVL